MRLLLATATLALACAQGAGEGTGSGTPANTAGSGGTMDAASTATSASGGANGAGTPPRRGTPVSVREADVPAEGALVLPERRLAVVRQGGQVFALDLACPHLGCIGQGTPQGFACPCHGSRFTPAGEVLSGPATRGLRRLAVERRGDELLVWS